MGSMRISGGAACAGLALCLAVPAVAQEVTRTPAIWHDRGDAAALDIAGGAGGKAHEPGTAFTFIKESTGGTSPKFDVRDEHGVTWAVKLGEESKAEAAATRLLWAAGYTVDEVYYRSTIYVTGLTGLARGKKFISGNAVSGARLERARDAESINWSWYENPFVGTREFNGLKVMMALINNWDLKDVNNKAFDTKGGGGQYGVSDLGATFGRTGNSLSRSKSAPKDYVETRFIKKVTPTHVDFVMKSRPIFPFIFRLPFYLSRTKMESIVEDIPVADARWIGSLLAQLSAEQIREVFSSSGFTPDEVDGYAKVVTLRIAALQNLNSQPLEPSIDAHGRIPNQAAIDARAARCLESTCRQVPVRETLTAINLKTPHVRAIVGGFDLGAGIGGGVQVTSAHAIPGIELRAAALTSTQLFRRFDVGVFVPKVGSSRTHADVWFSYVKRDTDFFGIGPRTTTELQTQFSTIRRSYQGSLYRDITDTVQAGIYTQLTNTESAPGDDDPELIPIEASFSGARVEPVSRFIPGFRSDTKILTYGGFLVYDTRDNSIGLTRGVNLFGRLAMADGVGAHEASTNYGWFEGEVDLRGYIPLGSAHTSLLVRGRGLLKTPRGDDSQIPFYDLAWLGGRSSIRGYHSYRFRGNNVVQVSTELQQTILSMATARGLDVYVFGDAGQVWGDDRSATDPVILDNQGLSSHWHSGLGGGLQYRHSRSVAVRAELGHTSERTIVYVSMSRGF